MKFTPTQWNTVEDKEKFAEHFKKFVANGFKAQDFHQWFYNRLSQTFGHIAHYNIEGFYATFFTTMEDKIRFLEHCSAWPCYGDPEYTYSDVEFYLKRWMQETNVIEEMRQVLAEETREQEIALRDALLEKYPLGVRR